MFTVFRLLLLIIHFLYGLFTAARNCCLIVFRKCNEIYYGENLRTEVEMLVRAASSTKKLPRHIVIVFGTKEDTILECVRIIGWCITLGIPYISFFDTNGFLAKNESFVKDEVAKRRPDIMELINWSKPNVTSTRNGVIGSKHKTRILFLSYADGKGEIVSLTQELAKAVITGTLTSEEINDDLLSEKLKFPGIPDPDLALVYGRICCTYGLLPWHTRTTEFFMVPMYNSLSVNDFTRSLEKYNKAEQRYGK